MMKKLLCLLLALVMLLSLALVSCDQKEDETEADVDKNTGAKTITLRIITEKEVCNNADELAQYLEKECGGDKESQKYKDMLATMKAYQDVEDEISKKTKSDFKTNVDILFYTEDEYEALLEKSMADYALEQKNAERAERALDKYIKEYRSWMEAQGYPAAEYPNSAIAKVFYQNFPEYEPYKDFSKQNVSGEDTYVKNDLGINELVYPEAEKNQLDIIYISGYDMYMKYVENEWVAPLNSFINTTGLALTYNISPTLLNGVKVNGETYAIPNNVQIGQYTYMLVDKDLAEQYKHTYASFDNIAECGVFVNDIAENHKDILPIDSTFEECMSFFVWYWNVEATTDPDNKYVIGDSTKFSVLGTYFSDPSKVGRGTIELGFDSLLANAEYRQTLLTLRNYELNGCYHQGNNESRDVENAAIKFVDNGTYAMYRDAFYKDGVLKSENDADYGVYTDENGKEYYLYIAKYPQAGDAELYGNMFAVSASSKNTQACMEVITLLNTDSTVRNLLQYGIKQGEHGDGQTPNYTIDETTGVLRRLNDLYMMKVERTGNCFIAYPEEGLAPDYWENAKAQNNDAVINPLMGFDFNERLAEYGAALDDVQLKRFTELSKQTWELIADKNVSYEMLKSRLGENGELAEKFSQSNLEFQMMEDGELKTVVARLDKLTDKNYDVTTGSGGEQDFGGESPYTIYYRWLTSFGYVPTP